MKLAGSRVRLLFHGLGKRFATFSRLQVKLWLGVGISLLIGLTILQIADYHATRVDAMENLLVKARTLRTVLMASGRVSHQTLVDSGLPITGKTISLLPIHALARISTELARQGGSELQLKVVSLERRNQHNPSDVPDVEAIAYFEQNPNARERLIQFTAPDGQGFYHYAQPILTEGYCLACHGDSKSVPASLGNGFAPASGYREGDLRGVMSLCPVRL